jgi:hypothetical protein
MFQVASSSVDASSTKISSIWSIPIVCCTSDIKHFGRYFVALKHGMMTLTFFIDQNSPDKKVAYGIIYKNGISLIYHN